MNWSAPDALRRQLERRWERGSILAARVTGGSLFPLRLPLRKPDSAALTGQFDAVRQWVRTLVEGSKERRGYGYQIEWREVNHRVHGRNRIPVAVVIATEQDALRWLGKQRAVERFDGLCRATLARFPDMADWLASKPLVVLDHAEEWGAILAVLDYFREHPRPGLYLRQLDIPGVDTKFIEHRRKLFAELLDHVLPDQSIHRRAVGVKGFASRYGLREPPVLVRFRILDPTLYIAGISDLSIPVAQFKELRLPLQRVFITENQINGLAFPDTPHALVIFGLGYGLDRLAEIGWLKDTAIHYWGDIDTHGYAILDQLRKGFPHARSFLMDRATLDAHRELCVMEPLDKRFEGSLLGLDASEQALFDDLKQDRLGEGLRLEQERVAFGWLSEHLQRITG